MSVMTRRMGCPLPWAGCRDQRARSAAGGGDGDLDRRYLDGNEHQRLCLWLEHREARAALSRLEAEQPPAAPDCFVRLRRWLGLPGI